MQRRFFARLGALALLAALAPAAARAAELTLYVAGAAKSAIEEIAPAFEKASGDRLTLRYDTVGALRDRVLAGETPDVILVSEAAVKALAEKGRIVPGAAVDLGRTGVGLATPAGRPTPSIATPEALAAYLRSAPSIGHADPARGATAGTLFRRAVEAMGLADELRDRLKIFPFGVEVIAAVARGELAVGVSQATEIVSTPGVAFVGFLPDPHQAWTGYQAVLVKESEAGRRFLAALGGDDARKALARAGFSASGR